MTAFDGLRNHDAPGITHPDRLAAGGAIDVQEPRRVRRTRDRIGDAAVVAIVVALVYAALVAL